MRLALLFVAAALACAQDGLKPRAAAADYPAHQQRDRAAFGAVALDGEQVRSGFATDLNSRYVVVEVAVFPAPGRSLDLGPGDFQLRVAGTRNLVRPAAPKTIAAVVQRSARSGRDVTISPGVGVGYESGPWHSGPTTGVGVGVGVDGSRPPASTDRDRMTMEQELSDKQLPEKVVTKPVAGYLYFPAPLTRKRVVYELEYEGPAGKLVLPLEQVSR